MHVLCYLSVIVFCAFGVMFDDCEILLWYIIYIYILSITHLCTTRLLERLIEDRVCDEIRRRAPLRNRSKGGGHWAIDQLPPELVTMKFGTRGSLLVYVLNPGWS